jgi:phosphomethylpyrimidine synthase
VDDVSEGVIASKIAARAADLACGMEYAVQDELKMARARKELDWETQIRMSVNPDKAGAYRSESEIGDSNVCTMCGEFCAIKTLRETA